MAITRNRNKKGLYRAAIFSSLIFAFFELPLFYLLNRQVPFNFGIALLFITLLILSIWVLNIILISITERYKRYNKVWIRFLFTCIIAGVYLLIAYQILPAEEFVLEAKRPWFMLLLLNMFVLNVVILRTNILRKKREQMEIELSNYRIQQLEAQQQQLAYQIQPHFLFNSLSTLKSLIRSNPDLAEEYLVKLSDFMRVNISANQNNLIKLSDELEYCGYYADMQQIRFQDSFFCQINVPSEVREQNRVPIFAVQSLVENAIKHNAFSIDKPLTVTVSVIADELKVSNNKLLKPSNSLSNGIGLINLQKRYMLIANAPITIDNNPETFTVTIKLLK